MRQNLTNVTEAQLDKVDSFYVVGSTTKEGLLEGRSNVKIDLKKAVAEGGNTGEITLAQAWTKTFNFDGGGRLDAPQLFLFVPESENSLNWESTSLNEEGIVLPDGITYNKYVWHVPDSENIRVLQADSIDYNSVTGETYIYPMYPIDILESIGGFGAGSEKFMHVDFARRVSDGSTSDWEILSYNGQYYIVNIPIE